jgi:hypothetical protein
MNRHSTAHLLVTYEKRLPMLRSPPSNALGEGEDPGEELGGATASAAAATVAAAVVVAFVVTGSIGEVAATGDASVPR